MANKAKNFLVSTADFALYDGDMLACTGTTNLNTSLEVTMDEQNINGGKGNKLAYSYKFGRELGVNLESADWDLRYLAVNTGTQVQVGIEDCYRISKCVTVVGGIITLDETPIGKVAIEVDDTTIVEIEPVGNTVDVTKFATEGTLKATYKFEDVVRSIAIDAESTPRIFKLVMDADRHNNKRGKVGSVQIVVPSFQPSGNFNIELTPDGVSSTAIEGKALAVEGDRCADGNVYAYINEIDDVKEDVILADIAIIGETEMALNATQTIEVVGLKGALYGNIMLENDECEFASDKTTVATVDDLGVVTAKGAGTAIITAIYGDHEDVIEITVG